MKHQIFSRALSLTAAAAMSCSAVLGNGGLQAAAARFTKQTEPPQQMQTNDETTCSVIVKVSGDAVMAQPAAHDMGADFLETAEAAQLKAQCEAVQRAVQDRIRVIYPELQIRYSYSTLYNGFSCELPESLINEVRALPDVVSVVKNDSVQVPKMDRAAALSGFPAYYDMTGCSGKGQVIAVIDSELDTSHPMFGPLSEDIETAVTREDIADAAASGALHIDVDPDRAYISNKLPYVIDYFSDFDPYEEVPDPVSYHGTHVSGIAAGNEFETEDGTVISGIAKDAQLMFFACGRGNAINPDSAMAAAEDAVILHADVINMSWGSIDEYYGENPMTDLMNAADNAGIVICNAAGNEDNGTRSLGRVCTPDSPDIGMLTDKAELGSPILFVASADNTCQTEAGTFIFNDEMIVYRPTMNELDEVLYVSDSVEPGDYEYVYCQQGDWDEIEAAQPEGKFILVDRGYDYFESTAYIAGEFGALGVIMIDKEYPDGLQYAASNADVPIAVITYHEGQEMIAAENKVITITGEKVLKDYPTEVSSYTSWGVKQSLDLRPDIMGIGGRVRSAAYESSTDQMSGTSMASPYVAGCAAVIREYLKQQGVELTGSELTAYIRRLLMNTAIPYEENGCLVKPRRQGAGLVSLDRAVSAKVLMTGATGDAKVNLYDNLGTDFSFTVDLTNYSDEDVTFPLTDLRLTTDRFHYDNIVGSDVIYGDQALNASTDLTGPVTIGAGQTASVTIRVTLNAAQYAELKESFVNGFFIEGFLMLSGAENSADISIPVLGFSDDWAQLPISESNISGGVVLFGQRAVFAGFPFIQSAAIFDRVLKDLPEEMRADFWEHPENYMTEEELQLVQYGTDDFVISPNADGIADLPVGIALKLNRWTEAEFQLLDADGNVLYERNTDLISSPYTQIPQTFGFDSAFDMGELEDGEYTMLLKAHVDYPNSYANPQEFRKTFRIDRNAPEVESEIIERDGRTILSITASDDQALQGIAVNGNGSGGIVGVYDPETADPEAWSDLFVQVVNWRDSGATEYWASEYYAGLDQNELSFLPYVLRKMGSLYDDDLYSFNFEDVILPDTDDPSVLHVEYDVTDLENYSFTVLDNAYNFKEIRAVGHYAEDLVQVYGVWEDIAEGLYEITPDAILHRSYYDGSLTAYSYTAENDTLLLTSDDSTKTLNILFFDGENCRIKDEETGSVFTILLRPDMENCTDLVFHPVNELVELAIQDAIEFWATDTKYEPVTVFRGKVPEVKNISLTTPNSLMIDLSYGLNEDGIEATEQYSLSLYTGRGSATFLDPHGTSSPSYFDSRFVNLFEVLKTSIAPGIYYSQELEMNFLFNEDGKTGMLLHATPYNQFEFAFTIENMERLSEFGGDVPFTYTIGEDSSFEICYGDSSLGGMLYEGMTMDENSFMIKWSREQLNYSGNLQRSTADFTLVTNDMDKIAGLLSVDELKELAVAYENVMTGKEFDDCRVYCVNADTCTAIFNNGDFMDSIEFNYFTLKGNDRDGNEYDLLNPPYYPENAYSIAQIEEMARNDFVQKTGEEPFSIESKLLPNGKVRVTFFNEWYDEVESYVIDPVSGQGSNLEGEAIDLPQTGVNDPETYVLAVLAFLMMTGGMTVVLRSLRTRKDEI